MNPNNQLEIGMDFDAVVKILGQPTSTTKGAELIGGEGTAIASSEAQSRLFHTEFCQWSRPEGRYELTFEFGRLARAYRAPPGTIPEVTKTDDKGKVLGRVVIVVFAEDPKDRGDACRKVLADLGIELDRDAIVSFLTDERTAVDTDDERCLAFFVAYVLKLLHRHSQGLGKDQGDITRAQLLRFRSRSNSGAWNAGVVFVVPQKVDGILSRTIKALWGACCVLARRCRC